MLTSRNIESRQAAIAYLIYGIIYMGGAFVLDANGVSDRPLTMGYIVVGIIMAVGIPLLINKGYTYFNWFIILFMGYRVFELIRLTINDSGKSVDFLGMDISLFAGKIVFALIAAVVAGMILRATLVKD